MKLVSPVRVSSYDQGTGMPKMAEQPHAVSVFSSLAQTANEVPMMGMMLMGGVRGWIVWGDVRWGG